MIKFFIKNNRVDWTQQKSQNQWHRRGTLSWAMEKKGKVIEIREKIIWVKRTDKTENIDKRCCWEKQKRTE